MHLQIDIINSDFPKTFSAIIYPTALFGKGVFTIISDPVLFKFKKAVEGVTLKIPKVNGQSEDVEIKGVDHAYSIMTYEDKEYVHYFFPICKVALGIVLEKMPEEIKKGFALYLDLPYHEWIEWPTFNKIFDLVSYAKTQEDKSHFYFHRETYYQLQGLFDYLELLYSDPTDESQLLLQPQES